MHKFHIRITSHLAKHGGAFYGFVSKLIELAEILTEKEVIFEGDLHKIFGERPFAKEIEQSKEIDEPKVKPEASKTDSPKEEITEENSK